MRYFLRLSLIILNSLITIYLTGCSFNDKDQFITATGTIEATEIDLAPKIGGILQSILVEEGASVTEGDTLAIIDHQSLEIQLRGAQAGIESAQAKLQLLLTGARSEDIRQAEEGLKQAEINLKNAQDDYHRTKSLFETGSVTQKQMDDISARYNIATAQYNSAEQALKKMQNFAREEEIHSAKAGLEQARASRDLLKKTLDDCYITAPIAGTVTEKAVEIGEFINPGGTMLTLTNLELVYLTIYIPETDLGKVKLKQKSEVEIDSYPDRKFPGEIVYISPSAEFTPKNIQTKEDRVKSVFAVKIALPNPELILKPGMPADAKVFISHPDTAKAVEK
jgi:HlyD family secretion protein